MRDTHIRQSDKLTGARIGEEELHKICEAVDEYVADYLAESITHNMSYDKLEAKHGRIPICRNSFYVKRKRVQKIIAARMRPTHNTHETHA